MKQLYTENLKWYMEAALERLLELPPESRKGFVWHAIYELHAGLAGEPKGLTATGSKCMICGAGPDEMHKSQKDYKYKYYPIKE